MAVLESGVGGLMGMGSCWMSRWQSRKVFNVECVVIMSCGQQIALDVVVGVVLSQLSWRVGFFICIATSMSASPIAFTISSLQFWWDVVWS
ncbi:hypothetical protein BRADI_4g35465v3 [Brachypodium distachyon]|uniref:Uncharacterized protein n=1 Tax=Brachypodium distachyon TaxID=15368 RepID=A0A2K2CSJ7_BRADI|nr:hypothetical protein BRADI_4g35465v3 [Brachypodium distachyon]